MKQPLSLGERRNWICKMRIGILWTLAYISLNFFGAAYAHHPLERQLFKSGNIQKAVDLTNLKQNGNVSEMFSGGKGQVVVTDIGNKILRVAGDLPTNGTLFIQGESYMELFDPKDIRDPLTLLQKIIRAKTKPVSVSLPVTDTYFIFSAPRALDKITGRDRVPDIKSRALTEAMKHQRVKRHHPTILSSMLSRLQSYALVPIKTSSGATRYLLLKEPKFIVYNKDQQSSDISQPQIKMQPLQPSSAIPKQKLARPAQAPAGTSNQWLVSPLKDKSKVVAIGRMPPEAGGGGLTAANQGSQARLVTSAPDLQKLTTSTSANPQPKAQLSTSTAQQQDTTTTKIDMMVSKMAVIADGISKPQEIINFETAKADALRKLDAVIINNAERQDVVNFAKSLLNAMKTLNTVVVKHGERRDISVFAQSMLSGLKKLDEIFKTGNKQQVVEFGKSLVDIIKQFHIESEAQLRVEETTLRTTLTTTETTTTLPETTTVDIPEEISEFPTTTEEYEMEDFMTTTPYYHDFYIGVPPVMREEGAARKPTTQRPPPGVAGWKGPTTEPALGPLDRINTTDVPEEIEAKPDKTPAEKRRDFLERNPHLRGKLGKLTTPKPTAPPVSNTSAEGQTNSSQTQIDKTNISAPKRKNKNRKKSGVDSLILRRKPNRSGKLKISGSFLNIFLIKGRSVIPVDLLQADGDNHITRDPGLLLPSMIRIEDLLHCIDVGIQWCTGKLDKTPCFFC